MTLAIAKVTDDKKDSFVHLVKTKIKEGKTSKVRVGKVVTGILADDIKSNKPIYIKTSGKNCRPASSKVIRVTFTDLKEKMVVETETSIYEQIIK